MDIVSTLTGRVLARVENTGYTEGRLALSMVECQSGGSSGRLRPTGESVHEGGRRMASGLRPLGDRVVIKPLAREEVTKSGIVLPDTATEKPQQGQVVAVGPGRVLDSGD